MGKLRTLQVGLLALLATMEPLAAVDSVEVGDLAWAQRAGDFARDGRVPAEPARRALTAYEQALAAAPESLDLRFKVMEARYFCGYFLTDSPKERRRTFEDLVILAEDTVAVSETSQDAVRAHFWAAISWGLWGMSHSYLASGAKGVAGKVRDHAQKVISLDPGYADGGGLRLLGRLHTATPRIPLFTGWIDREEGLALLERALELSDEDPRNALFLAEAILEYRPADRRRALELLRELSSRSPDPDHLVEQSEALSRARRLLADLERPR